MRRAAVERAYATRTVSSESLNPASPIVVVAIRDSFSTVFVRVVFAQKKVPSFRRIFQIPPSPRILQRAMDRDADWEAAD